MLALALVGCDGGGKLVVQVRSDLAPGSSFADVSVTLAPAAGAPTFERVVEASATDAWGQGVRLLDAPLEPGDYRVVVAARDERARVVVSRPVRVSVTGSGVAVVTVLLTVSCAGVSCPSDGDDPAASACLGGRCANETCVEEMALGCPDAECATADECPAAGACSTTECTESGTCFAAPNPGACAPGELCDPVRGCVPDVPTADYVACETDASCEDGQICVREHGTRCRAPCIGDAECGVGQRCGHGFDETRDHCMGDTCDLDDDSGCPVGLTCSVVTTSLAGEFVAVPSCRPRGRLGPHAACETTASCRAGHCTIGTCEPYCTAASQCESDFCVLYLMDWTESGVCAPLCDPRDGSGCAGDTACFYSRSISIETGSPGTTSWCTTPGTAPIGGVCRGFGSCVVGATCVGIGGPPTTCQALCVDDSSCSCGPLRLSRGGVDIGYCSD